MRKVDDPAAGSRPSSLTLLCLGRIQISPCQLARMPTCPLEGSAFAPP